MMNGSEQPPKEIPSDIVCSKEEDYVANILTYCNGGWGTPFYLFMANGSLAFRMVEAKA